ncbi:hypothetical protein CRENBAI_024565 [Crenichthys baileyi]|uniref:PDZ domain-containing protein n=1 Tax=Crenichthys baileyi TaxID=28760 RepID=A0AAV9QVK6_9TELE
MKNRPRGPPLKGVRPAFKPRYLGQGWISPEDPGEKKGGKQIPSAGRARGDPIIQLSTPKVSGGKGPAPDPSSLKWGGLATGWQKWVPRCSFLESEVYQLQTELQSIQMENKFHKQRSLQSVSSSQTPQLQEAHKDILEQDLAEAIDSQVELAEHLKNYREENEKLLRDKQGLVDQTEGLSLQVQQLSLDCKMHQQKSTVVQSQMKELQVERDQAYQSRDDAQAMIARILAEKDTLRSQLVELQEAVFIFQAKHSPRTQLQRSDVEEISWESPTSSSEECPLPVRRRLRRMDALNPMSLSSCYSESEDAVPTSVRSKDVEPPSPESLRRRQEVLYADSSLSRTSAPPFLVRTRPKAIRINGRVLSISLQCEALLSQLTVVGGNKSGVFVHQVTEGSAAHTVGISPGAQIVEVRYEQNSRALKMVLEDSTLEEATWALSQVTGFCHLSLRPRQNDYEALLQQLQNSKTSSGDSFYIRVNISLPADTSGALAVSCNDILHVTNTRPADTEDLWHASQVHPCQLLDLQSGTVGRVDAQSEQKAVRIVSTGRQGRNPLWVSVEEENTKSTESGPPSPSKSCVTLMPYTLVTPHFPPVCRPILLLPTILGRMLDKKLDSWQGFQLCEPDVLTSSEHAAQIQRSEILEEVEPGGNQCYTLQSVDKVMKKGLHCVLPLGLDCVRRLHRFEIFPIIIFIGLSARNARKLSVDPDSWCDQNSLLTSLRTRIWEEQRKIVWVEPDLW